MKKRIKGRLKPRVTRTALVVTRHGGGEDEKCVVVSSGSEKTFGRRRNARVGIAPGGWQSRMGERRQDRETERKTWGSTHASIRIGYGVV